MRSTEKTLEEVIQYLSFCIDVLAIENNKNSTLGLHGPTSTLITVVEQIRKIKQALRRISDKPGEKN